VIDHCVSYLQEKYEKDLYNEYVTTALYAISANKQMNKTLREIKANMNKPKENRSGKEVAEAVAAKMNVKINWQK